MAWLGSREHLSKSCTLYVQLMLKCYSSSYEYDVLIDIVVNDLLCNAAL